MKALSAISFWEWINLVGVIAGLAALIAASFNFLNNQKADTDRKIAEMEHRWDKRTDELEQTMKRIDNTVNEIKADLKKTSDLLNADLSWRYLYKNDPTRKNLAPRYHPDTRTLELVDTTTTRPGNVRKP